MTIKTEEDFINLVKTAEQQAEAYPKVYLVKLALFALLGYLVILLVLIALLGLAGGLVASALFSTGLFLLLIKKKLIIAVGLGIWVLLRALWVRFPPPQGYTLNRKDFPELFAELDTLSKQLHALKIHEVILDRNLNAAVVQHPRLGILGWHKNYLILGYQLLLTLSPEEMRSVLAHELGHLSANHSRFSGWIYRVRQTWNRIMSAFDGADSWGGRLMHRFFDWYSPRFAAYSFALARSNEYEADAIAAELTSPEIATRALVNVHATAPYVDQRYWDNYYSYADKLEQPPYAPFVGLTRFLRDNQLGRDEMIDRIKAEMAVETHYADTHPSLKDRVDALNAAPQLPVRPKINSAEAWLGKNYQKIMEDFDREWLNANGESWQQRYEYVTNARERLQEFSQAELDELSDEELWKYAYWTNEFESSDAAMPLFLAYQERHPDDPDPAFFIGIKLLNEDEPAGLEHLRLARKSASLIERAAHAGYNFLKRQGKDDEAEEWWQASIEQNEIFIAAHSERDSVTIKDTLVSPQIDEGLLEQLLTSLKRQKNVGKIWLAQKTVQYFPESPVYIIVVAPKGFSLSYGNLQRRVAENLEVEGDFFVVCKVGDTKALAKKVIKAGKRIK